MQNYYKNCGSCRSCGNYTNCESCEEKIPTCAYECTVVNTVECDKYKQKSDELYIKAHCVQEESKRLLCESEEYSREAKELERKARDLCAKANVAWDNAIKLESETTNLLDLASFYCHKASECYKNMNNSCKQRPPCNMGCNK